MEHLMDAQLDRAAGADAAAVDRERWACSVHLETRTTAGSSANGHVHRALRSRTARTLDCDLLVVAAGIRPNVELAARAGLAVKRGIVVGDDLASRPERPGVYAVGECAEHRGQVYGLVAPLWEQAQRAGRSPDRPRDRTRSTTARALSTKLKVAGVDLAVMGEQGAARET